MSVLNTTAGSNQITVTLNNNGALNGDYVLIENVSAAVGGIPAAEINTDHLISNATTNTFTITTTTTASSSASYTAPISFVFDIHSGTAIGEGGYGWGAGSWSRGAWGSGTSIPINIPPRLYTQDRFNDDLLFCIRNADIYYWEYATTFDTRAVLLSSLPNASDVPQLVGSILFSQQDRHLLAFGGTSYGTNVYDPLLIRWASQDEPWNFTPATTNSAGFLRVTNGSEIIRAVRTRQEILVLTDSTLYSLQFLGTAEVFQLYELADNISVISPASVITVNNVTYWMGIDKFYLYNGRVDTLPCTLRQYIFQDINRQTQIQSISGTNEQYNEIIWFYPSANSEELNRYVIYNYVEQIWYYGQLERTAWLDSPLRPYPQAAATSGWVFDQERGVNADGAPLEAYISSGDIDIEDGEQFMLIRRIIPDINFTGSTSDSPQVQLTIQPHNFPGQTYQTNNLEGTGLTKTVTGTRDPATAIIDQYTNQVFLRARGRQMRYKIASDGLGVQWQMGMPRIDARPDGKRG
jgi:hypothetical protein